MGQGWPPMSMRSGVTIGAGLGGKAKAQLAIEPRLEGDLGFPNGEGVGLGCDGCGEIGAIGFDDAPVIPRDRVIRPQLRGADDMGQRFARAAQGVEVMAHLELGIRGIGFGAQRRLGVVELSLIHICQRKVPAAVTRASTE